MTDGYGAFDSGAISLGELGRQPAFAGLKPASAADSRIFTTSSKQPSANAGPASIGQLLLLLCDHVLPFDGTEPIVVAFFDKATFG